MSRAQPFRVAWTGIIVLWILLPTAGVCAPASSAPIASPVEIRCERIAGGVPKVVIRNRTGRPLDVSMRGLAYAGQGQWEHWWTQHDIHLPPRGKWTAQVYEVRGEKFEVRDRRDRLLASVDLMRDLPPLEWDATVALHSQADWQPFRRQYAFGQKLGRWFERIVWRTITPDELALHLDNFRYVRVRVIGSVRAERLAPGQLAALRGLVERGQTLLLCGGADLNRLRGWERAGLLAAPVRGTRAVPGLPSLAGRYGVGARLRSLPVADVGAITPPARVLLAERDIPLVVERPLGAGKLLFVTFDPARPPFRGSPLEAPFWQEWARRGDDRFLRIAAIPAEAGAYKQMQRRLHMLPPATGALVGFWLGYLLILFLVLIVSRRRIRGLVAAGIAGSAAALALGPRLYRPYPVASFAGLLYLRSGDGRGWWRGSGAVMVPRSRLATLRVPDGSLDFWDTPTLRLPSSPHLLVRPRMRRWVLQSGQVDVAGRLRGDVTFEVDLEEDGVSAFVRNRTPYTLKEVTIIWGRIATRRLGELPPGSQTHCRLARSEADGLLHGVQEGVPAVYGEATGFGNSLDTYDVPLLLAHCPGGPRPTLLVDERPVPSEALTALLVAPPGFRCRGRAFRLPDEVVTARLVRAGGWSVLAGPRVLNAGLVMAPQEWSIWELFLPPGASRGAWRRLELLLDGSLSQLSTFRLRAFDWVSEQWVPIALLRGTHSAALPSPERLIQPQTGSILVRMENASDPQSVPAAVSLRIGGDGDTR